MRLVSFYIVVVNVERVEEMISWDVVIEFSYVFVYRDIIIVKGFSSNVKMQRNKEEGMRIYLILGQLVE